MSGTEYTPSTALVRAAYGDVYCEGKHTVDHVCPQHADFDRWLAAHGAELTKRVRAEQRRVILLEVMMIPCWITGGRSEFDIPGESHRDTVLAAIREATDD